MMQLVSVRSLPVKGQAKVKGQVNDRPHPCEKIFLWPDGLMVEASARLLYPRLDTGVGWGWDASGYSWCILKRQKLCRGQGLGLDSVLAACQMKRMWGGIGSRFCRMSSDSGT